MNANTLIPKAGRLTISAMWVPVLLLFLLVPWAVSLGLFSSFYINLITKIFIYAIFLLGFDLLAGYTGLVSFGHAMFFGLGAYTSGLTLVHLAPSLLLGIVLSLVLCSLVGVVVGFLSIRTQGVYFIFITLAFAQFFRLVAFHWSALTGGENGLPGIPADTFLGIDRAANYYYFVFAVLVLCYILARRIVASPFGHTLVGIRENEERMKFLGYNVDHYKWASFVISGAFGGLAGALFAHSQRYVSTDLFNWLTSADVIIMTWLGGVGTLIGPMLGGGIVIFFKNFFSSWMAENWLMIMGFVYVLLVLFSPRGLMGLVERVVAAHRLRKQRQQGGNTT